MHKKEMVHLRLMRFTALELS